VKDLKDGGQVDEAKHVGDAAPAGPEAPKDAEAPAQSAGQGASPATAPSPPEAAGPAQPPAADRQSAAAPEEAPSASELEPAAELSAVTPAAVADAPASKADGEDQAAEPTVAGGWLPRPATEPEAAADPEAAEPQTAVVEAVAAADPEPRVAEAVIEAEPEPQATAEPTEPQVEDEVVAAEPQPQAAETVVAAEPQPHETETGAAVAGPEIQAAEAVAAAEPAQPQVPEAAAVEEPEPQVVEAAATTGLETLVAEAVAAAEPEPQGPVTADAAGPEPQPAEALAPAEPEPQVSVEPAEPQLRVPDAGEALAEAEAGAGAQVPRAVSPPVERAGVAAAPRQPAPEAAPSWDRRTEPPAPAVVLPQGQAARPAAARLPASLPSRETAGGYLPYLRLALRGAAALCVGLAVIVLTLVVLYRWVDPPASTLMLGQRLGGTPIERRWVPLERISPHLIKAVILSEDGAFCRHRGVDWTAIEEAMESARGGSTITMQVVKNLFLWPSRSYVRKAIEIALAYLVDAIWPKRRILEIYLNIAEWGDGVFGAEAAARHHFGKSAGRLTAAEAALLAVALPSPTERTAGSPSPAMSRLARRLLTRMAVSQASLACVRAAPRLARQAH
jgi:monofunctional biosynthetic peptidoglycan transglycosylase